MFEARGRDGVKPGSVDPQYVPAAVLLLTQEAFDFRVDEMGAVATPRTHPVVSVAALDE